MARIDDYINAKKLAAQALSTKSFHDIADKTGFQTEGENTFKIPFLERMYRVEFPGFEFVADDKKEVPIQEQVLILHYLLGCDDEKPSGKQVAYREIPGAAFYFNAFVKRAVDPLKNMFGKNVLALKKAAENLSGNQIETGDAGFEFQLFPKIGIQLIIWEGDEDFPPDANILFDRVIGDILSPEDVAWLSGMLVYRLMSFARR